MGDQIDWDLLAERAWAAREQAYCPHSNFAVGAALLAESGEIFAGCNVENASFGLTICAERVAVSTAITAGHRKFTGMALVAETAQPVLPCGACCQFLAEFHPSLAVYSVGHGGIHGSCLLSALLPSPFEGFSHSKA